MEEIRHIQSETVRAGRNLRGHPVQGLAEILSQQIVSSKIANRKAQHIKKINDKRRLLWLKLHTDPSLPSPPVIFRGQEAPFENQLSHWREDTDAQRRSVFPKVRWLMRNKDGQGKG